ncbi:helix-turn-helix domain-containing protein [Ralstonia pseudosolanacearum]|uniref:helix-turn-helix domain-containing protein n=1 Tax=Ralstonia pseudosolanacearum TaxID=1310165 RepID=UPI003AADD8CA
MRSKKYLQFSQELAKARQQSGVSQKAAALSLGIDQSYLCALEKGRRAVPGDELIRRIALVLRSDPSALERLLWAAAHDRAMGPIVADARVQAAAEIVSAALLAASDLSGEELQGLADYVTATHAAKKRLLALVQRPSVVTREEEALMK